MGGITCDQHLEALRRELDALAGEARRIAAGLDDEALGWAPGPGHWSVAQCFEHLTVTGRLYHPVLAAAVERARTLGEPAASPGFRPTRVGRWVAGSLRDRSGRRTRSPRAFHPAARPEPGAAERLAATLEELAGLMSRARGTDLNRVKTHVPATRLIRFNLGDALEVQVAHIDRHLEQARRVREDPAFPRRAA